MLINEKHNPENWAIKILNSKGFKSSWKKDFKIDNSTEDWDLTNSEGIKIEVKSTISKYKYDGNYFTFNTPKQKEQILMKFLKNKNGKMMAYEILCR